ncbi:tetratricopeptide repeat protein [Haloferula sp. A504]|uniref:tetratricopeptide repeat protein n=1 Tax=Haloferula sp. A504 TaxID=3373601 RepID=UPI0031CB4262|nr:tetratricopeptide repeat protein [Verrucomicrobiaceae bacterium E54]
MTPAFGDKIIPPSNLFRDPQFVRDFVGSYGFHSEVEPKVSPEESRILVKLRELFEKGRFSEAESELVRFIKETEAPSDPEKQPREISPAMVFVLGNLYFSADRTEEARRAFLEAIRRFPKFRRAHVNLGYLYVSKEDFDKAMRHFQEAVSLGEGNPRVFGLLGYCYLLKQQPLAAENAYRQAYLLDPGSKDWKLGLAQTLLQQEKLEEATALLGTLIESYPEDQQLWLQQTQALLGQERKMEAAVNLEILRMKGLAGESELNLLGNLYMDQGEPQLALFAYLAAIEKGKELDIEQALKSAKILNDYGYPEKADQFVRRVRALGGDQLSEEDEVAIRLVEVGIARSAEDLDRVGVLLEDLLARDPANAEVVLELGKHYDTLAKLEEDDEQRREFLAEAKTRLQIASGMDEVAYGANLALGQLHVREKQYVDALPKLERALELKESDTLKSYVAKVRRAADRQQQREEREAAEREAKEAEEKAEKEANQ